MWGISVSGEFDVHTQRSTGANREAAARLARNDEEIPEGEALTGYKMNSRVKGSSERLRCVKF